MRITKGVYFAGVMGAAIAITYQRGCALEPVAVALGTLAGAIQTAVIGIRSSRQPRSIALLIVGNTLIGGIAGLAFTTFMVSLGIFPPGHSSFFS